MVAIQRPWLSSQNCPLAASQHESLIHRCPLCWTMRQACNCACRYSAVCHLEWKMGSICRPIHFERVQLHAQVGICSTAGIQVSFCQCLVQRAINQSRAQQTCHGINSVIQLNLSQVRPHLGCSVNKVIMWGNRFDSLTCGHCPYENCSRISRSARCFICCWQTSTNTHFIWQCLSHLCFNTWNGWSPQALLHCKNSLC